MRSSRSDSPPVRPPRNAPRGTIPRRALPTPTTIPVGTLSADLLTVTARALRPPARCGDGHSYCPQALRSGTTRRARRPVVDRSVRYASAFRMAQSVPGFDARCAERALEAARRSSLRDGQRRSPDRRTGQIISSPLSDLRGPLQSGIKVERRLTQTLINDILRISNNGYYGRFVQDLEYPMNNVLELVSALHGGIF